MPILRMKNRSNNSVVYFPDWFEVMITFSTSWWLSQHCHEEGYLQKYLKVSSVFPKASHGFISVDLFFIGDGPTPGFTVSRVCCDWSSLSVNFITCMSCKISFLSGTWFLLHKLLHGMSLILRKQEQQPFTWRAGIGRNVREGTNLKVLILFLGDYFYALALRLPISISLLWGFW